MPTAQKFKTSLFGFNQKQVYEYIDLLVADFAARESDQVKSLRQKLDETSAQNKGAGALPAEISTKKDEEYRERIAQYEEQLECYKRELEQQTQIAEHTQKSLTDQEKEQILGRILLDTQKFADDLLKRAKVESARIKAEAELEARHISEALMREAHERLTSMEREISAKENECREIEAQIAELKNTILTLASNVFPDSSKSDDSAKGVRDKTVALRFLQ